MKFKYILVILSSFLLMNVVHANDIKSIDMDIYVDNNGDAHIKETWVADLDSGTEGYKPYYNLGTSEILDYKVKLDGKEFTTLSNWNVNASFNYKSYKAGLNKINNGYELCFGISKYGVVSSSSCFTSSSQKTGLKSSNCIGSNVAGFNNGAGLFFISARTLYHCFGNSFSSK